MPSDNLIEVETFSRKMLVMLQKYLRIFIVEKSFPAQGRDFVIKPIYFLFFSDIYTSVTHQYFIFVSRLISVQKQFTISFYKFHLLMLRAYYR